ncbi:MAG: phosphoribosyltransferase family protein [Pseudomarimonas sp.]
MKNWLSSALASALPEACLACGEASTCGPLCAECRDALPWNLCACPRCALPLPAPALFCGRCVRRTPPQTLSVAPLRYAEPVDRLVTQLKFAQQLAAGRALVELMQNHDGVTELVAGVSLAVPIPLHRTRLRERGYNQALELLRPLLARTAIPLSLTALIRHRHTLPQTGLDAPSRRRNLRRAFSADPEQVKDHCVLLVDDVITTGTTVAEAARTLLHAGAREVRVLAAARVARG